MLFRPPKSAPKRDAQIYARLRPIQKWKESLHKYFGRQIGRRFIRFWADNLAHNWASNFAILKKNWASNWDSNLVKLGVKLGNIGHEIGRQIEPNRASNWAPNCASDWPLWRKHSPCAASARYDQKRNVDTNDAVLPLNVLERHKLSRLFFFMINVCAERASENVRMRSNLEFQTARKPLQK